MCGRFALEATSEKLRHHFNIKQKITLRPRYNIAPSQSVVIIRAGTNGNELSTVRWGLIPHWSKDEKIGFKLINARAETVQEKPSFREAFKSRRCLIPATGFYEWKHEGGQKQPYFIRMMNGGLFGMAGLWESWHSPEGRTIESCSIITTEPNTIVAPIHNRMPVIIPKQSSGVWLSLKGNSQSLQEYLKPFSPLKMTAYPVSSMVNSSKNEGKDCTRTINDNEL